MACAGNAAETCGGSNRLDLYSYGGSVATSTTSTRTSTSSSAVATSTGWNFRGCYTDAAARTLVNFELPSVGAAQMTVEACQTTCRGLGYTLAGLEYADECCLFSLSFSFKFSRLASLYVLIIRARISNYLRQIATTRFKMEAQLHRMAIYCATCLVLETRLRSAEARTGWICIVGDMGMGLREYLLNSALKYFH